ncbi:flagellar protein of basal-body outer-membrane L ring [Burkholderiales bacterium]|nr:flagellar protein of basal-body outer-membrane L ring [Burkholderiales bacterium]
MEAILQSTCCRGAGAIVAAVVLLCSCAAPRAPVAPNAPITARPHPYDPLAAAPTGAIFRPNNVVYLFEDRKPRVVGDLLTIQINENTNASQTANSSTEKKTSTVATLPKITGVLGHNVNGLNLSASGDNAYNGTGQTASTGVFTGTITVTVIEVLANGNLVVAGDKQIGIRQNSDSLRFTGVVDPALIQPGNIISSTQVADARLDYRGGGYIEEAQIQGWLGRFFNSWSPF